METMKKNGKYIFVAIGIAAVIATQIGIYILSTKEKQPQIVHYLNRLLEYFEIYELDAARQEFLALVGSGMDASEAFWEIAYQKVRASD